MKTEKTPIIIALLFALNLVAGQAEDWTTTDGRIYRNVTVVKSEPDAVTILYSQGGALVPLAQLPPELQHRFHYAPEQAQIAAAARAKADAQNAVTLQEEMDQTRKLKAAKEKAEKASKATTTPVVKPATTVNDPNHFGRDSLLKPDTSSSQRHFDADYPQRDDDHKNTSYESHTLGK